MIGVPALYNKYFYVKDHVYTNYLTGICVEAKEKNDYPRSVHAFIFSHGIPPILIKNLWSLVSVERFVLTGKEPPNPVG